MRLLLRPGDLLLLGRISLFVAGVPLLVRLRLPTLGRLLGRRRGDPPREGEVERIISYVDAVLRRGILRMHSSCLTRGLTLYYFLRGAGLDVSLCFGIGERSGETVGHCWLEKDGEPFLEQPDPHPLYVPMYTLSPVSPADSIVKPDGRRAVASL